MNRSLFTVFKQGRLVGDVIRRYSKLLLIGMISISLVDLLDITLPLVLKAIVDGIESKDMALIERCCLLYALMAIVQAVGRVLWRVGFYQLGANAARDIRQQIHQHLLRLPVSEAAKKRSGDILTHAQSDMEAIRVLLEHGMVTLFDGPIYLIGISLIMFCLSPRLALASLFLLPLIPLFVFLNGKRLKERASAQQKAASSLTTATHEGFSAIRVIKSFAREPEFIGRFSQRSEELRDASIQLSRSEAFFAPQLEFVISASITLFLYWGSDWVTAEKLSIGTFVAFQRYIQSLLWPTQAIGVWFSYLQRAVASSERIEEFLSEPEEQVRSGANLNYDSPVALSISGLEYSYQGHQAPVLKNINLTIMRGERVALLGPSSAGKTTLCNLILKVLEPQKGAIELYGCSHATQSLEEVRQGVSSVEQRPFLFSDTILNNISPALKLSDAQQFIEWAALSDEVNKLPLGAETVIGERGITLSGGQKQRVAIARSLAKSSHFFLWDNALSSVDLKTEMKIIEALKHLPLSVTALLVTHRLSTARLMDRIVVLRDGIIEQEGTHEQLVQNTNGWYFQFCKHQERIGALQHRSEGGIDE